MTERERAWWRRSRWSEFDQDDLWWFGLMRSLKREVPIEFAAMQFEYAMELTATATLVSDEPDRIPPPG